MNFNHDDRLLIEVKEVCRLLSLSSHTVYELCAAGVLEKRYIGRGTRNFRVPMESVRAYADQLPDEPRETW